MYDWEKPAPLYSNNVLLVCRAEEVWEHYKNVICVRCQWRWAELESLYQRVTT